MYASCDLCQLLCTPAHIVSPKPYTRYRAIHGHCPFPLPMLFRKVTQRPDGSRKPLFLLPRATSQICPINCTRIRSSPPPLLPIACILDGGLDPSRSWDSIPVQASAVRILCPQACSRGTSPDTHPAPERIVQSESLPPACVAPCLPSGGSTWGILPKAPPRRQRCFCSPVMPLRKQGEDRSRDCNKGRDRHPARDARSIR